MPQIRTTNSKCSLPKTNVSGTTSTLVSLYVYVCVCVLKLYSSWQANQEDSRLLTHKLIRPHNDCVYRHAVKSAGLIYGDTQEDGWSLSSHFTKVYTGSFNSNFNIISYFLCLFFLWAMVQFWKPVPSVLISESKVLIHLVHSNKSNRLQALKCNE